MKTAFITGITGQDGSYLSELLLEEGFRVVGLKRRTSTFNTARIDHLIEEYPEDRFDWVEGDILDQGSIITALEEAEPDHIYHLACQSHVGSSFKIPQYTLDTIVTGTTNILEAVRVLKLDCRIYNAASSEMFGNAPFPQNEDTPMEPVSPYGAGKQCAYNLCMIYRESYGMWIANGILYNHESIRRGETFVTRKVTMGAARILTTYMNGYYPIQLGNMNARRDWGWAPDYVRGMYMMLEAEKPGDYILATSIAHTVRDLVNIAFPYKLSWSGDGKEEHAWVDDSSKYGEFYDAIAEVNPRYYRPNELHTLCGNASKAREELGWEPTIRFEDMIKGMVQHDLEVLA